MTKVYVIKETMKNAKEYFEGQLVLQGIYNDKRAVLVSAGYNSDEECYEVFSASPSNRYLGKFIPTKFVDMKDAKGIVLVCK